MTLDPVSPPARLVMSGVRKVFAATIALAGVDLRVGAGEVLALIGENGAGKSTLMKILTGAHRADAGTMSLDGMPYEPQGPLSARKRGVAVVYQELTLAPHLSVAENVLLGATPAHWGFIRRKELNKQAQHALAQVGGDDIALDARTGDLPIAQQQLVEIARAIACQPRLLVLDEPTSSLTRRDVEHLFSVIRRLASQGVSIIYISHFLEECRAIADRYVVLRDGRSVGDGCMADVDEPALIRLMVGREMRDIYPRIDHVIGKPVMQVAHLAGRYKPSDAGFTLHRGEILGLFGLIGSGRSEMLRALFALDPLQSGSVHLHNVDHTHSSPRQRLRDGIGLVSENRKEEGLALNLSIAENLTMTRLSSYGRFGFLDLSRQRTSATQWMERLAVKARNPDQAIGELSGGNQQKIAIGRLLHHGADILLLDEPTRGIDVGAKAQIYRMIGELAASGKSVILVSSYIPELIGVCDTIAVMCRGVLGRARPVGEWDQQRILTEAIGQGDHAVLDDTYSKGSS